MYSNIMLLLYIYYIDLLTVQTYRSNTRARAGASKLLVFNMLTDKVEIAVDVISANDYQV
jgi:hypothetical protein